MPWKIKSELGERWWLIRALLQGHKSVVQLCRQLGISRKTAYKWRKRFWGEGRRGLSDRSRAPRRRPTQMAGIWRGRLERLRQKHPDWGAKKIWAVLRQRWGGRGLPCVRTFARWLERLGLVERQRRRPRRAGRRLHPALTVARRPNHVWTVDFKGWFRTADGTRVEPLTVRDLFSRYGLCARLLADQRWRHSQAVFTRVFLEQGLPEVIRVDNGGPFGSKGPAGLSRLSAWWVRLGIQVEFIAPGHPEQNGAHEQFHRVFKRETTRRVARTRQGQQHKTSVWLKGYNTERPHEALGQRVPAQLHRKSRRCFPRVLPAVKYPGDGAVRQVRSNGEIKWGGRRRFIGEAFIGQPVGLKRLRPGKWAVYFCHLMIGHLHQADVGAMRPMAYRHRRRAQRKEKV